MVIDNATSPDHDAVVLPARSVGGIVFHDGPVFEVADSHIDTLAPARLIVHEWHEYRVECTGAALLQVGSETRKSFGEGTGLFRWQFSNHLGLSNIRAFGADGDVLADGHIEVVSPKLGGVNASLEFFRTMLADLTSEDGVLAFLPSAPTSRTVRQVQRPPSLLIQYFFLLNNADAVIDAVEHVKRAPHRVLDDETEQIAIHDLTDVDPDVVLQLVQGGASFDQRTMPPRLKAAPSGVWFRVPREGFDSAENRFVKAIAAALADACEDVLGASWLRNIDNPAVAKQRTMLSQLRGHLREFTRAPMFDEVGPLHRVPASSRVMQRRSGYRDLNLHWQSFLTSREPVWQRMQRAIDLRDVATLYEYWVWFALIRELRQIHNAPRPIIDVMPPTEYGLPQGLKAEFTGIGTLRYNQSRRAYSGISLRPDYLWEPKAGANVGFDAKFRLAWDQSPLDVDDEAPADPIARSKADDLVKMHAYRDAISGLRAAIVLYPGHVAQFRKTDKTHIADVTIADVLLNEIEGVGAIPMSPVAGENNDG